MPAGLLVTVPVPSPASVTVSTRLPVPLAKLATTEVAVEIVNVQGLVPSHVDPPHPVKVDPAAGVAVKVTCVPLAKFAEHVLGHVIPAGALVTAPAPVPASVTVRATPVPPLKVAVTVTSEVAIGIVHEGGLVCGLGGTQFGLKPPKVDPAAAVAVNVTLVLSGNAERQLDGQLMPLGVLVTVPLPVPASVTIKLF